MKAFIDEHRDAYPSRRGRSALLCSGRRARLGSLIQTKWPPGNPARFTLTQRWMGHAKLKTTAIYTAVSGPEERGFAEAFFAWSGERAA